MSQSYGVQIRLHSPADLQDLIDRLHDASTTTAVALMDLAGDTYGISHLPGFAPTVLLCRPVDPEQGDASTVEASTIVWPVVAWLSISQEFALNGQV